MYYGQLENSQYNDLLSGVKSGVHVNVPPNGVVILVEGASK